MEKKTVKAKKVAVKEVVVQQEVKEVKAKEWKPLSTGEIYALNTVDNQGVLQFARAIGEAVKAKNNG